MPFIKYLLTGVLFGIILSKSEVISWFRIQEMFLFHSFHMYGIISSAIFFGALIIFAIKKFRLKDIDGNDIVIKPKDKSTYRYLLGGIIFGLGWAMTGACPGPLYTLIGQGFIVILVVVISAVAGTLFYGLVKEKLPH